MELSTRHTPSAFRLPLRSLLGAYPSSESMSESSLKRLGSLRDGFIVSHREPGSFVMVSSKKGSPGYHPEFCCKKKKTEQDTILECLSHAWQHLTYDQSSLVTPRSLVTSQNYVFPPTMNFPQVYKIMFSILQSGTNFSLFCRDRKPVGQGSHSVNTLWGTDLKVVTCVQKQKHKLVHFGVCQP